MAALAVLEGEVAAEGALAIVTGQTARAARGDEVFCSRRRADLASLGCAGGQLVAVSARESFFRTVVCVAEGVTICAGADARGPVWFPIVADAARRNLASGGGFARRCVTCVASGMCAKVSGYEETRTAIKRSAMTTGAAFLRSCGSGVVLRVIEIDVERFGKPYGKVFERRVVAVDAYVTDRAHRYLRRSELAAVTISARFVTREAWRC